MPARSGRLEEAERADDVGLDEGEDVPLVTDEAGAGAVEGGVDDRVAAVDQGRTHYRVPQRAGDPLDEGLQALEAAAIAAHPIPAAAGVAVVNQLPDDVSAEEPGRPGDGDLVEPHPAKDQAMRSWMTRPWTSVRRKSRPA